MNERIKELAEQAGMNAIEPVMDFDRKETHWNGWASAMEKFAELIVRECMSKLYLNGYDDAMIQLQKDFGLGE